MSAQQRPLEAALLQRKEAECPREIPHTRAGVWPAWELCHEPTARGGSLWVWPETLLLEILGNQMAQDLISLGFLSRAARPSLQVKAFCPWLSLAQKRDLPPQL